MRHVTLVCDNTLGAPGLEVDDGLALLYLLGCDDVAVDAVCTTHGNADVETTYKATRRLADRLAYTGDVLPGAGPGVREPGPGARRIQELARPGHTLLSLGATTEFACAERERPGTLASYDSVVLMGGVLRTLVIGGCIMDELNLSVDPGATMAVLDAARGGARVAIADSQHCLPLTFAAPTVARLLGSASGADIVEEWLSPWFDHAAARWGVDGFVGWDVLAAVAVAEPDLVRLVPYEVALDPRMVAAGLLERAEDGVAAAPVCLVEMKDPAVVANHVLERWARALRAL